MERFEIRKSEDEQYYFVLVAKNNQIIGLSERYTTKQNCQNGIDSVKRNAPNAPVIDKA